jgi:hemin uptake protein HemP
MQPKNRIPRDVVTNISAPALQRDVDASSLLPGTDQPLASALVCRTEGHAALPLSTLLNGVDSLEIDHDGAIYVLRLTKARKLILTKQR